MGDTLDDQAGGDEEGAMSEKRDGVGTDGTIPGDPDGVAAGSTPGEPSTFEPEEDPGREGSSERPAAAAAQREESDDAARARADTEPDASDESPAGGIGAVDGGSGGNQDDITPDGV